MIVSVVIVFIIMIVSGVLTGGDAIVSIDIIVLMFLKVLMCYPVNDF